MQFDASYKPTRDGLTPDIAALMDRAFYARRTKGLNVQFINELGQRDEWSFNDVARRDAFIASLEKRDIATAISF